MPAPDRVLRAAEALDDDTLLSLVGALPDDSRRALAGALRVTTTAFFKATSPSDLFVRSLRRLPPPGRADAANLLTEACLDDTVEALGDDSDDPNRDQLLAVLDPIIERHTPPVVALMLAATAGSDAPARAACAEILDTDDRFKALSEPATSEPAPVAKRSQLTPEERAERDTEREARRAVKQRRKEERRAERARREAAAQATRKRRREARRDSTSTPTSDHGDDALIPIPEVEDLPPAPSTPAASTTTPGTPSDRRTHATEPGSGRPPPEPVTRDGRVTVSRRTHEEHKQVRLVGNYDGLVDDDPLLTAVVVAEVPYEDETGSKVRPAVVVGALRYELIVRPCYSEGGSRADDWRFVPIGDWREAGLDGPSRISDDEVLIPRAAVREELGNLSAPDWNQL